MSGPAIELIRTIRADANGQCQIIWLIDYGYKLEEILGHCRLSDKILETQLHEPVRLYEDRFTELWLFRNKVLEVKNFQIYSREELLVHVKHYVLKAEGKLEHMKRVIQAFENLERVPIAERERIPEAVRLFAWQRDGGKCVRCGSREKLEFDHIIPVADGGSSTERNVQLLCEPCNRQKGRNL